ncbi:Uncharacterized protein Adt_41980 [Abeliophyllum distichum]|uniref:Uncharacterized protein n=1 Tax=Abeliophyllum distichum TaxID=126358 RepID=A0ABD1PQD3_9LAMI
MIAAFLLWRVIEVGGDISSKEFESIYRPCRSANWYNKSPCPDQKWKTTTDSPNKEVSSGSTTPTPTVGAPPVVQVRDDSSFLSPVIDVGSGSSSSSPIMEARADLPSLPSDSTLNLSTSILSQGKGEGDVQSYEVVPKEAQKRRLLGEGAGIDSEGAKKSRTALPQETSGSNQVLPSRHRDLFPTHPIGENVLTFHPDELDPKILERLLPPSDMEADSLYKYWTAMWAKVIDGIDLHEMIRMAKMNTVWSHVLNWEFYKKNSTKVDELCS